MFGATRRSHERHDACPASCYTRTPLLHNIRHHLSLHFHGIHLASHSSAAARATAARRPRDATRAAPLGEAAGANTTIEAVLGVLQLLPVQKKTASPGMLPRPEFTAIVHSAWVKAVKNVQFVPGVHDPPLLELYSDAVTPLHTPATRTRCGRQWGGAAAGGGCGCRGGTRSPSFSPLCRLCPLCRQGLCSPLDGDAPETVTQMVFGPWSTDTGGLTGAFQPGPRAVAQPLEQ